MIFEVTEGVIMHNQDVAVCFLRQLRDEGIEFQIDDFGTGHSSLSALHELPVAALKIDRSFVQRMQASARSRELVGLMITMGARFGLTVIAEGVETGSGGDRVAEQPLEQERRRQEHDGNRDQESHTADERAGDVDQRAPAGRTGSSSTGSP